VSPKGLYDRGVVLILALLRGGRNFRKWSLVGGLGDQKHSLSLSLSLALPLSLSLSLSLSLLPGYELAVLMLSL
jgi:hypothetical protein